jgi:transposase
MEGAGSYLEQWQEQAKATGIEPVGKVAGKLGNHLKGLLNYTTHRITNAISEGFNAKIQVIKSAARGFRTFENFRISILFHCGKLNLYPQ